MGVKQNISMAYSSARALLYFVESLPLPYIDSVITKNTLDIEKPPIQVQKEIIERARDLLLEDSKDFENGYFGLDSLIGESKKLHFYRWAKVLVDAVELSFRKKSKNHKSFSAEATELLEGLPEYYQRNFHFQKDGYLSDESAEIYDHQVELLFKGTADPMRRMVIRPLKNHFPHDGTGLKILDVACGAGSSTRWIRSAYPRAHITGIDLSLPYLSEAKSRFKDSNHMEFIHGKAESLPFNDGEYDIVTSVFLFHELPKVVRSKVIEESLRVLKPHGMISFVDSIQLHDAPELEWSLKQFPKEFHEPFYGDYIKSPLEDLVDASGAQNVSKRTGFYSKSVSAYK